MIRSTMISLLSVCALISFDAHAANIYKPGTTSSKMYEVVAPVLGDSITPIFLLGNDPVRLIKEMDSDAVKNAQVSEKAVRQYVAALKPDSYSHGVVGYILGGYKFDGNESSFKTCAIVFANANFIKTTETLFHEAIHCKNSSDLQKDKTAFLRSVSHYNVTLGLTKRQYQSSYHEALSAFLQVSYHANEGRSDGLQMVKRYAAESENKAVSIGYRTARAALKTCGASGACPTDTSGMVKMLSERDDLISLIHADMVELLQAAVKNGYVVADN